jgi:hypothetical protein
MKRAATLAFVGALFLFGAALVAFDELLTAIFGRKVG